MTIPEKNELRRAFREVTLSMLGVVQLYDIHSYATKTTAQAFADVFRTWLPDLQVPPLGRGRAALQALADALRPEPTTASPADAPTDSSHEPL